MLDTKTSPSKITIILVILMSLLMLALIFSFIVSTISSGYYLFAIIIATIEAFVISLARKEVWAKRKDCLLIKGNQLYVTSDLAANDILHINLDTTLVNLEPNFRQRSNGLWGYDLVWLDEDNKKTRYTLMFIKFKDARVIGTGLYEYNIATFNCSNVDKYKKIIEQSN